MLTEIRIAGLGGQGVILAGMILGKAACLYDAKHATLTQSFGPEARGSACSAQVIVADEPILYPYLTRTHILVAISQEACQRFGGELRPGGKLIYEKDLVRPDKVRADVELFGIPATRLAEELGRRMVLNIVMVGFITAVTSLVSLTAVRQAVANSVPAGTEKLNLAALEAGYEFGRDLLRQPQTAA